MKTSLRELTKDIAIYGLGDLVLKATAFITLPIYTRIFTPEDYGVWSFVTTCYSLLSAVLVLGGDSAYARYFFAAKTLRDRQTVTSTWLGFLTLWSAVMVGSLLPFTRLFSEWSFTTTNHAALFSLSLLAGPLSLINTMCGQVLRNQFKPLMFMALNVVSSLLAISLGLYATVILGLGLTGIFGGTLLAGVLMLPARLWSVRGMLRPLFSLPVLKSLLSFGVPLVPASVAYWVFVSSDRVLLARWSTLQELGYYSVATSLASVLALIHAAVGQAWSPRALHIYETDPESARVFFGRLITYLLAAFGLLSVGVATFAPEALRLLASPAFYPAAAAVGPLALGFVANASTQVTAISISLTKRTHYFAVYSWAAALLNIGLNVFFIPRWGMVGASWTTAISYAFLTLAYLVTSQRLWAIAYESSRVRTVVGLTTVFVLASRLLPELPLLPILLLKSVYSVAFIALLFGLRGLDSREWRLLKSLVLAEKR